MKIKPEDIEITIDFAPNGFGAPKRILKIKHIPSGIIAKSDKERSDHANREHAFKSLQRKVNAHYKNPPKKKFSYTVGYYWTKDKDSIDCYTYGNEVHSGTIEDANNFLNYVKEQSPDEDWKIFMLVELPK